MGSDSDDAVDKIGDERGSGGSNVRSERGDTVDERGSGGSNVVTVVSEREDAVDKIGDERGSGGSKVVTLVSE